MCTSSLKMDVILNTVYDRTILILLHLRLLVFVVDMICMQLIHFAFTYIRFYINNTIVFMQTICNFSLKLNTDLLDCSVSIILILLVLIIMYFVCDVEVCFGVEMRACYSRYCRQYDTITVFQHFVQ